MDDITIEVNIKGEGKHKRYSITPIKDDPELVKYFLMKCAKEYERETLLAERAGKGIE